LSSYEDDPNSFVDDDLPTPLVEQEGRRKEGSDVKRQKGKQQQQQQQQQRLEGVELDANHPMYAG
jgi:hypothetical protein